MTARVINGVRVSPLFYIYYNTPYLLIQLIYVQQIHTWAYLTTASILPLLSESEPLQR